MSSATRIGPGPMDDLDYSGNFGMLRPLWTLKDITNEEEFLKWGDQTLTSCFAYYNGYFKVQMDNLLIYKGIHWLNQAKYSNKFLDRNRVATRQSPKVVINHLYDFVEQWVSRLTRFKPAVKVYPANAEYEDEQDAKVAQLVLDHIWYVNNIDSILQEFARQAKIFGESYLYILWDTNKGDVDPAYVQAKIERMQMPDPRIPVVGEDGEQIIGTSGDPLYIDRCVKIGDLSYEIDAPWHTLDMPCSNPADIDWCIRWKRCDVDFLRAKYPDKADKISADKPMDVFNRYELDIGKLDNETVVYELWHRSTEMLEKGRYIKWCKGAMLENTNLPYSHGMLPRVKFTDVDVPDEIRGMSFYQQLFPVQHQINACASLIFKSLVLFSHPKIVMPDGACEITQLVNESTVVTYQGGVPPTLMTNNAVSQELFAYLDKLERTAEKLSGVFTMSRGQAPSGVRAAKALRVLEEQEDKRGYITSIKYNEAGIIQNAKMTLSVAGDYYNDDQGRLARVVGKGNRHMIVKFEQANLAKPKDIRIEQTTALSRSPSARIEEITELQQTRFDPMAPFSREQFFSLLDFDNVDEFKDVATRAVECAKSENEDLLSGKPVPAPSVEEDLIQHWLIHRQPMQGREYKEPGYIPDPNKDAHKTHFLATEYLMWNKAYGSINQPIPNELFKQKVMMMCPDFPVLFTPPPMLPMMAAPGLGMGAPEASGNLPPTDGPLPPDAAPAGPMEPMPEPNQLNGGPLQ